MIREVAAKRYAEAAYQIAREQGSEERWLEGLALMAALFGDRQIQTVMEDARIPAGEKVRLVEQAMAGADPMVLNLALLLLHRGRTALGPQIAEAFRGLVDEAKGVSHAVVTTAVSLSEEEVKAVAQKLSEITGKQVVVETQVDEGILGGLVARIGDRLIDGSTRSRLEALKRELAGARV